MCESPNCILFCFEGIQLLEVENHSYRTFQKSKKKYLSFLPISGNPFGPCRTNASHPMESIEEEPCPCQQFQSAPGGQWSQCILEVSQITSSSLSSKTSQTASQFCGIGKRYRRLDCLDATNQITDPK